MAASILRRVGRRRNGPAHQLGQLLGGRQRLDFTLLDDPPGNPPAESLLAVAEENVGQVFGVQPLEQPPGRLARFGIETQIERTRRIEAESALGIGQLIARQAEVEQNSVDRRQADFRQDFGQIAKIGLGNGDRQAGQVLFGRGQGRRVAVERKHQARRANPLGQSPGMAAGAERAVDKRLPGLGSEPLEDFVAQHRNVQARGDIHARPG